jgi:hypothetical protein
MPAPDKKVTFALAATAAVAIAVVASNVASPTVARPAAAPPTLARTVSPRPAADASDREEGKVERSDNTPPLPVAAAASVPAKDPQLLVDEAFGFFKSKARTMGITLPEDLQFPADKNQELCEAYRICHERIVELEAQRQPIISQILEEKRRLGQAEHPIHPQLVTDPEQQRAATLAMRVARQPTRPHQSVSVGGAGSRVDIIRIDETEDARLPGIYASLDQAVDTFVDWVSTQLAIAGHPLPARR